MRAEQELLLCCARTTMDAGHASRIRKLVKGELDWAYLLLFAERHALAPLLYTQLSANVPGDIPHVYLNQLQAQFRANAARNLLLTSELCRILRLFESEGVRAMPYKGPALAVAAYGNLSLRRFADLDVLVPIGDVRRAKELLISQGYKPEPSLTQAQEAVMLRTQHNLPFLLEGKILLELHWTVAARKFSAALDADEMWERAVRLRLEGETVRSLSTEDLLLSLCVHGSKHLWERLAWVCDVAELVTASPTLNWRRVFAQASRTGDERMLFLGLRLAVELMGATLPAEVTERVFADAQVERLAAAVRARLSDGREKRAGIMRNMIFNLRARKRLRDKIGYLQFALMPTDADLTWLRLPAPLTFIYYVLRPVRMLLKCAVKN